MGLRLIRQKSETPNILSTDDARMVRYAYGGYDGVVKNRGTECGYEASGNTFKITSGVIVLQGWEVEIDGNGWQITVDSMTKYYAVYLEVNLSTDTAEIKSVYDTTGIPAVNVGDDLTRITNGIARLVLYTFKSSGNVIENIVKKISAMDYTKNYISAINQRIDELGFKEASLENGGIALETIWSGAESPILIVEKMAKFAILKDLSVATKNILGITIGTTGSGSTFRSYVSTINGDIAVLPQYLWPTTKISAIGIIKVWYVNGTSQYAQEQLHVNIIIETDGRVYATPTEDSTRETLISPNSNRPVYIEINSIGWKIN